MDLNEIEDQNGYRLSYNKWPNNKNDAAKCGFPIGCHYTPLKLIPDHPPVNYQPVQCQQCRCVLNPYCGINFQQKCFSCPICHANTPLPTSYHGMTEDCLAAELTPNFTTIEYVLPDRAQFPPTFLFLVDTCITENEHAALKALLLETVQLLPPKSLVGFMSYGTLVYIHELSFSEACPRSFVFNGKKTYTASEIQNYLTVSSNTANSFILPIEEAEQMLNSVIDNLEIDPFPILKGDRAQRCTGAALDNAITLLEAIFPTAGAQILLFTNGPVTKGPGAIASIKKTEIVRQHEDIFKNKTPFLAPALEFYNKIATRAVDRNIVINYLSASFEETGLYEMKECILSTGGFLLQCESWLEPHVPQTIQKYFSGGVLQNLGHDCQIDVNFSKIFQVAGCIGPCTSKIINSETQNPHVSQKPIGAGKTTTWKAVALLPTSTLSFYFEIAANAQSAIPDGTPAFIQFTTRYKHYTTGEYRFRVTTLRFSFGSLSRKNEIIAGFDQEAAVVLLARYAAWRAQSENPHEIIQSVVDKILIGFCRVFADYNINDTSSFVLNQNLILLPQFIYHFRRSNFMSTFNSSPDQTAYLQHALLAEDVTNSLFMIQPTLMMYSLSEPPRPALLDMLSLKSDCVLLLDTFFKIVVWQGKDIVTWRNAGYQEKEEYANLKAVLTEPMNEAGTLVGDRFPIPIFIACEENDSKSRVLTARLNPCNDNGLDYTRADTLTTEEPSFSKFSEKLKEMAVKPK